MWIKQKSGSALFKMHSRKNIIVQQYAGTGHTVFWLFILAIYIVIVYNFYKDDYY